MPSKKPMPLSFYYKLFVGSLPDIVIPKGKDIVGISGTSCSLSKATKDGVLAELMEVYKILGETISTSIARKAHVDNLIKSITQEAESEGTEEEEAWNEEVVPEAEED
jgi:hypothetical protein